MIDLRAFREAVSEAWAHLVELAEQGKVEDALDAFKANIVPLTFVFCGVVMLGSCVFNGVVLASRIVAPEPEAPAPPPPEPREPVSKKNPWSLDTPAR